jgi:integrase
MVYLSRQAVALFRELHSLNGHRKYVFAKSTKSGTLSENFCTQAIKRMGFHGEVSGHGFRGTLSTILNEEGHFRSDVIERALSHKERDAVRAAYNHATYERELRELWQWWADALDAVEAGENVIPANSKN